MTNEQQQEKPTAGDKGESGNPDLLTSWEIKFPILKSRFYLWDIVKVMVLCFVLIVLLFAVVAIIDGDTKILGLVILIMGGGCLGLGLMILLVSAVMYAGGYPAAFALTAGGIFWASQSQRDKTASRLAILLGVLDRNPSLAAAGLIAGSQEAGSIPWDRIRRIKIYSRLRAITIKNSWRVVIRVYAKPENFEAVAAIIRERAQDAVIKTKSRTSVQASRSSRLA